MRVIGWLFAIVVVLSGCGAPLELVSQRNDGSAVRVGATLTLPDGRGPHPTVVLLHPCSSVEASLKAAWAQLFAGAGIATLVVDSFSGRGLDNACTADLDVRARIPTERLWDARAAAAWLRARPDIDGRRLVLMGQGQGGNIALRAQSVVSGMRFDDYAAYIALYPECGTATNTRFRLPTLILAGGADTWTPAQRCEALVAYMQELKEPEPELRIYPDAPQGFDVIGRRLQTRSGYGDSGPIEAQIGFDPAARAAAETDIFAFLNRHLGIIRRP